MQKTPKAEQFHIVLCGIRNSGKSSLMNNIFERDLMIISDTPGTTTDPVSKSYEMTGFGPVTISDTAGFDDFGKTGSLRIKKTEDLVNVADLILFISPANRDVEEKEKEFLKINSAKRIMFITTFSDDEIHVNKAEFLQDKPVLKVDNISKSGIFELRESIISTLKEMKREITPLEGIVSEGDLVVLVTPIDLAAPAGRLILPQVETLRDILDKDAAALVVKERELKSYYESLPKKPKVVITDSQAFSKVAADIPGDQMLTSFSIIFARKKGDLKQFINGISKLSKIQEESKILVLESCHHHRQADDIGTVKIPRLFRQLVQSKVSFEFSRSLPDNVETMDYSLVINCAGCMTTRTAMMRRLQIFEEAGIPCINYGLFLAWVNGLLPRALEPFAYEYELYKKIMY